MKTLADGHRTFRGRRCAAWLLAVLFAVQVLQAQPTEQTVQSRFLFVFDTSRNMKPRLEAVQVSLNTLLATSLGGQLHSGDSMGVWILGETLQTKGYQLQSWDADAAAVIASNLFKYVSEQHFAKTTHLEILQPLLNRVAQDSERLTVMIFCDGESKISGTPYDDAINEALKQKSAEQQKAHQPLVILLRSQLGQYVGCSIGLPPRMVTIPQFPPLPAPPPPAPKPAVYPAPPRPAVAVQPLIIIGKKPKPSEPVPATNPPAAAVPAQPAVSNQEPVSMKTTNTAVAATNPVQPSETEGRGTNPPVTLPESSSTAHPGVLLVGAGLVGAVITLGLVFVLRPHRKETSLITRSMNEPK